ncbi:MAG: sn-glycerol-1-phosphate dehydrogenase [Mesorhizobium sp.]|uniref:sn-glycerol-1-phosphate dehydrogenase n=2 Tax=Mesorhizobium sp. TaxID=1871066 RepID=UPI0012288324|nr:sn-glycerol-1-phosphate dehydrogenase [Mesorhizobium sp.]TIP75647.1 MAG: sn-glycerol-1-phosphate dehydrogenase [Mesorhizobium sp.]TIQ09163.1 MAG: sn-glycerol-1-phosphate dehydrogenase [Mesorhizobium sp.]TIR54532.1 MAG: sn-glycerol-1-phosphate dehydrogenase [Mesorhizobium sp.]TJV99709.1 MAG: sn-glycerol-1-phosphate dehydrogenase [Mesorhizobium sp.]
MTNPAAGSWTALIDDILDGHWTNPETGKKAVVPYDRIVIEESLEGRAADLVSELDLGERFTVVADPATYDALGERVARELKTLGPVDVVILDHPHADMANVESLAVKLADADAVVAVGSGTINDLCKFVTGRNGRRYCVFGTAGSMNGYTSTTASITLESGLKVSLPSHAPSGFFVDLGVSAAAPTYLSAAGFGDCLCRSVAQIDWWMSHRLLGTAYHQVPFLIQEQDEAALNERAARLAEHDIEANGYLYRVLTLCGLGISFTGVSNHGSMGEHQISHYIDCFAGERHPGTLHGTQVGVASLTMARLQQAMLASDKPPVVKATKIHPDDMVRRMGPAVAAQCLDELKNKAFDETGAAAFNERLQELWPTLRQELKQFMVPVDEMQRLLKTTGGPISAAELGTPADFYREAVVHCREMRNRFSFLDIAADAGMLEDFARGEA